MGWTEEGTKAGQLVSKMTFPAPLSIFCPDNGRYVVHIRGAGANLYPLLFGTEPCEGSGVNRISLTRSTPVGLLHVDISGALYTHHVLLYDV